MIAQHTGPTAFETKAPINVWGCIWRQTNEEYPRHIVDEINRRTFGTLRDFATSSTKLAFINILKNFDQA